MIFLTQEDLELQSRSSVRAAISGNADSIFDTAELAAISEVSSYLNGRFDTTAIFAATGDDRNPILKTYLVDIMLYHVHSRVTPNAIPELREKRYKAAMDWLQMVAKDLLNPDLPLKEGRESGLFKGGSRTKTSTTW